MLLGTAGMDYREKRVVYVLRSERDPHRHDIGLTSDLAARLAAHNNGMSVHTAENRPWCVTVSMEFSTELFARRFEFKKTRKTSAKGISDG